MSSAALYGELTHRSLETSFVKNAANARDPVCKQADISQMVVGVDEVGRGSWAGPLLVVAARSKAKLPSELTDSKLLSRTARDEIAQKIVTVCDLGEGWVQPEEIDKSGLAQALRTGIARALVALGCSFEDEIILDGQVNYCPSEFVNVRTMVKADLVLPIVSAASIYAKVKRDAYMTRLAQFYPFYGFENNAGYGTALHASLLKIHGVSSVHRKSYKPVRCAL